MINALAPGLAPSSRRRALVVATVVAATWMASIDSTITNLAFRDIAGGLNVSIDEVAWISTSYVLAMVTALPLAGWLAANIGRKRAFIIAVSVFTVASLACALSGSLVQLTLARFVQGFAAGAMQPLAAAALLDAFPREDLPKVFKYIGFGGMVGPLAGPILGGTLLATFPWPSIFLINLPIGAVTLWLAVTSLHEQSERGERSAFDWSALALLGSGLAAMQFVIQQGPRDDWFDSPAVTAAALTAVAALALFVRTQLRASRPLVDLRPLASPSFTIGLGLAIVSGIGLTGTAFIVPLFFEQVLGFDAATAGLGVVPAAIATLVGIQIAGMVSRRISPIVVALVGLACFAAGTLWFCLLGKDVGFAEIVAPRLVQGLGNGLIYLPLNVIIMRRVPQRWYDAASGLSGLARQLGVSLGYAVLSGLLVRAQSSAATDFASRVRVTATSLAPIRASLIAHGFSATDASTYSMSVFAELAARNALLWGYNETFFIIGMLSVVTMPVVAILWRSASRGGEVA